MWSELVPIRELARSPALAELASRGISLLAAVQPSDRDDAVALALRARELGLSIGLWPLLEDAHGRWLHPGNAGLFAAHIEALLGALDRSSATIDALALDLEPPIAEVRRVIDGDLGAARAWLRRPLDASLHARLTRELSSRGIEIVAAAIPPVLLPGRASRGWQRALGAPIDDVPYDTVSSMLYTTLFEGYSFGALGRADARALLSRFSRMACDRFGARASVSLGAVGVGALGDERTYRSVAELADDVALARAAGIDDLALFDLGGVLSRPPIEPWLDALAHTEAKADPPPTTARASATIAGLHITGLALELARPR